MVDVAAVAESWNSDRVLKNLRRKLTQTIADIEDERLKGRSADLGVTRISDAPTRTPMVIGGEVQGLQVVPRAGSPSLEVTISDGSGRAVPAGLYIVTLQVSRQRVASRTVILLN